MGVSCHALGFRVSLSLLTAVSMKFLLLSLLTTGHTVGFRITSYHCKHGIHTTLTMNIPITFRVWGLGNIQILNMLRTPLGSNKDTAFGSYNHTSC